MSFDHDGVDDEFLRVTSQAMRESSGAAVLDTLGWWDLLDDLSAVDSRTATFAAFRAQGRELADSPALAGLMAQPFIEKSAITPGSTLAATARNAGRRGLIWVIIGDFSERSLLFDDPARGPMLVDASEVEVSPVEIPGRAAVYELRVELTGRHPLLTGAELIHARVRSNFLGRLAIASEILGTTERAVELAVEYAKVREQFGKPIGTFQAVRHLLALAKTDCMAIEGIVRSALLLFERPPARYDEVVKALAGRNGLQACERSLQVLGGIGFTAEHPHHHHHSRVLLLDSLLGSSAELSHGLGKWLRESGDDPGFPASILAGARQ